MADASPTSTSRPPVLSRPAEVAVVVLAALVGGPVGLVMGVVAVMIVRSEGETAAAHAAALLLGAAAAGTILVGARDIDTRYALDRGVAALAAQWAGVCLIAATGAMALRERSTQPWRGVPAGPAAPPPKPPFGTRAIPVAVAALVLAVRWLGAPTPLRPDLALLVANLRVGRGYTLAATGPITPTAIHPPLAPILAAAWPGPLRVVLVLVSGLTVIAVWRLARRMTTTTGALLAGLLAAGLPSLWGQQLPEALAALGVAAGIALAWPAALDQRRAAAAGACLGSAVLARPETIVVLPVVLLWGWFVRGRPGRVQLGVLALVAASVLAPWELRMHRQFDTWLPSTSLGATLQGANRPVVRAGDRAGELAPLPPPPTREDEGAVDAERRTDGWKAFREHARPGLIATRILRGWDLWSPDDVETARAARGVELPGGTAGVIAEAVAGLCALLWLALHRGRWRDYLPVFALPALFTVLAAVTYGSRDYRSWVAPVIVVAASCLLASVGERVGVHLPRRKHSRG